MITASNKVIVISCVPGSGPPVDTPSVDVPRCSLFSYVRCSPSLDPDLTSYPYQHPPSNTSESAPESAHDRLSLLFSLDRHSPCLIPAATLLCS